MCEAYCRCLYAFRGRLEKRSTVDKSKIKDKIKVKSKDKSWVKIGWRTKTGKVGVFKNASLVSVSPVAVPPSMHPMWS